MHIRHLVVEIRQIVRETFPKSIELSLDIPQDLWQVLADTTQLHQVLMNLCVNARDAMTNGGTLTIAARNFLIDENYARMNLDAQVGRYIIISVGDTGMGIAPEILDKILNHFSPPKKGEKGQDLVYQQ